MPLVVRRPHLLVPLIALVCWVPFLKGQAPTAPASAAHNPFEGAAIFRQYCASCHGVDARGHGPAAVALKHAVPDLTLISQRNQGKFPAQKIKKVIEGSESSPIAHGNREMPIWGPVFHQVESDQDLGEVRLETITKYLESLQRK